VVPLVPIVWRRVAWFVSFAIALALAAYVRILGFGPLKVAVVLLGTWILLPFIISQAWAALVLRRASKNVSKATDYVEQLEKDMPRILQEYTKCHTDFPGCVIDTSWLPADKKRMVEVLKFAWLRTKNDEARTWLESGWQFLSWFQDGVGDTPINVLSKTPAQIPPRQLAAYMKDQNRWLEIVSAESEILARECAHFKQVHSNRPAASDGG
jgi:hypothetical protein